MDYLWCLEVSLFSSLFLPEPLTPKTIVGGLLITVGTLILAL
jgi:uncharacterized membrane protein